MRISILGKENEALEYENSNPGRLYSDNGWLRQGCRFHAGRDSPDGMEQLESLRLQGHSG